MTFYPYCSQVGRLNIPIQDIFVSHKKITKTAKIPKGMLVIVTNKNEECNVEATKINMTETNMTEIKATNK